MKIRFYILGSAVFILSLILSAGLIHAAVSDRVAKNFFHDEASLVLSFYQDQNPGNVISNKQVVLSFKRNDFSPYTRDAVRCRNSEADCWTLDFENKRRDKKTLGEVLTQKYGSSAGTIKLQATLQAIKEMLYLEDIEKQITGSNRIFFETNNRFTQTAEVGAPMPGKSFSLLIAEDCKTHFMLREFFDADGLWDMRSQRPVEHSSLRLMQSHDIAKNLRFKALGRIVTQTLKDYIEAEFPEKLR